MPLLDHFGLLAPIYERYIHAPPLDMWGRVFDLPVETLVLDVGGGTGRVAAVLASAAPGVIVVDASVQMLHQATRRPGICAVQAAAEALPFLSGSFAQVLMVDALHHVESTERTVSEMLRVLAPGGRLVIEEPDWRQPPMRLVAWVEKVALMRSHPERPETILNLARQAGAHARCFNPMKHVTWIVIDK